MAKKALTLLALVGVVVTLGAAWKCHSEQFWLAKRQLQKMVLTPAQRAEIAQHQTTFEKNWSLTCQKNGCRNHDHSAVSFVTSAAGVLTAEQFKSFMKRERNPVESVGYDIRLTGQHLDDLLKIAKSL